MVIPVLLKIRSWKNKAAWFSFPCALQVASTNLSDDGGWKSLQQIFNGCIYLVCWLLDRTLWEFIIWEMDVKFCKLMGPCNSARIKRPMNGPWDAWSRFSSWQQNGPLERGCCPFKSGIQSWEDFYGVMIKLLSLKKKERVDVMWCHQPVLKKEPYEINFWSPIRLLLRTLIINYIIHWPLYKPSQEKFFSVLILGITLLCVSNWFILFFWILQMM